jgi:hypothetical protein
LVPDNPYAPSDLGGAAAPLISPKAPVFQPPVTLAPSAPAAAPMNYAPSEIHSALISAGVPPSVAPTLTAVSGAESGFGRSTLSPPNKDGSRDHGVFQVNDKAWPQFKNVAAQPLSTQAAIAAHIYNTQGLKAWSTYNNGAYKKYLGANAAPTSGAPPGAPATAAPQSNAQRFADAYRAGNAGGMLAALSASTGDEGKGKSALQDMGDAMKEPQLPAPTPALPAIAQAPPDTSASSQQLLGQVLANQQAPLSWGSRPFGAQAGPQGQQVPGVTLNSGPRGAYALNPMSSG